MFRRLAPPGRAQPRHEAAGVTVSHFDQRNDGMRLSRHRGWESPCFFLVQYFSTCDATHRGLRIYLYPIPLPLAPLKWEESSPNIPGATEHFRRRRRGRGNEVARAGPYYSNAAFTARNIPGRRSESIWGRRRVGKGLIPSCAPSPLGGEGWGEGILGPEEGNHRGLPLHRRWGGHKLIRHDGIHR